MSDNVLLFTQYRAACRLRRMCCKHALDGHGVEQRLQSLDVHARCFELDQRILQPARLIDSDVAQVIATPANAVHFLRRVDHLKVGREASNQLAGRPGIQVLDQRFQFFTRFFVSFSPANCA